MKHILFVDDCKTDQYLFSKYLEDELTFKVQFLHAYDTKEAEDYLKYKKIDLILLDVNLTGHGRDGFVYLMSLKCKNITKDIPVIILTSYNVKVDAELAKSLGAEFYLEKGWNEVSNILLKSVETLLKK